MTYTMLRKMLSKTNVDALKLLAPKCPRNHICIEEPENVLGEVTSCVNNKVLFVKHKKGSFCTYKNSFGHSVFCTCPVRMKIYQESANP